MPAKDRPLLLQHHLDAQHVSSVRGYDPESEILPVIRFHVTNILWSGLYGVSCLGVGKRRASVIVMLPAEACVSGCFPFVVVLADADRAVLEERARAYTAPFAVVVLARIVLLAAQGGREHGDRGPAGCRC